MGILNDTNEINKWCEENDYVFCQPWKTGFIVESPEGLFYYLEKENNKWYFKKDAMGIIEKGIEEKKNALD